ncbi:IclR family transcriptional regulator [Streptomyces litchfieldiae]|uniref:IclR family transcriptional regulator n=1 Tax=Streptomyces litchfieldiae TaxID=3075543 RepID=A0ABU2MQA0_9ACTN|nr:IclR family transcriptional regulator [Streptomyces sp. DSM 44938]MDT0343802.1 IclR family transcriptional regulator [Streptomyces sp. DSM 44938]
MSQTVGRALEIVGFIAERPRSLGETADRLGVHKSTALRLLRTLEADGFARKRPDGRYAVGLRVIALARQVLDQLDIRDVARPHLAGLSERVEHTVHLAALLDGEIVYVDKVDGAGPARLRSRVGRPAVLHTAAVAKVILAHLEPPLRERLLAKVTYRPATPATLTTPEALRRELALVAGRGWAEDDAEGEPGVACVALPVRDAGGRVRAGLSVTSLAAVTPLPRLREALPELRAAAGRISRELGWGGDVPPETDGAAHTGGTP